MKKIFIKLLIICLINVCHSWSFSRTQIHQNQTYNLMQQQYWFPQLIDHLNYQNSNSWLQRFFVLDNYFDPLTGPIILYICGSSPQCRGLSDQSFTIKIAQQTRGLVLALQHRYYGKSLPFGSDSLSQENLRFLNADQALRDLAYFLKQMSKGGQFKITPKNPWITIGGSYPGALSAWFRNKFPHLTIGALSSSGAVLAVEDFRMFDEQIYISSMKSGQYCANAIVDVTTYVQGQVTGDNKQQFRAQFKAQELSARQFLFYWSDVIANQIILGNRTNFCNSLKNKTLQQQFHLVKSLALKVSPVDYGAYYLKNATFAIQNGVGARAWAYQSCTQFGFFQTYAKEHPMRARMLTIDFFRKWCDDIFGNDAWPFVQRVNNQFGGLNLNVNNLIITNGDQDPWQWASLQKSKKTQIYAHIITCDNCAHSVDLHAPNKNDAKDLVSIRTHELDSIKKWISDYWKTTTETD